MLARMNQKDVQHLTAPDLKDFFTQQLNATIEVATVSTPLPVEALSEGERQIFERLTHEKRRASWLTGRNALRQLLKVMDLAKDTSRIVLPHPQVSLTHCQEYALAVGARSPLAQGLGVDFQKGRKPSEAATRLFLTEPEREWLIRQPESSRAAHRLRLWTIKEALFKADLDNANRTYTHYEILQPEMFCGVGQRHHLSYQYASCTWLQGFVTVALKL